MTSQVKWTLKSHPTYDGRVVHLDMNVKSGGYLFAAMLQGITHAHIYYQSHTHPDRKLYYSEVCEWILN